MTPGVTVEPFLLQPACMDYLWGGNKLKTVYGKQSELTPLAESWECSVHPDGPSLIASGNFAGRTLSSFLEEFPEAMGEHGRTYGGLPILVKLIDAEKDLSIQVHPDDDFAKQHEGQLGKTEMWYVLRAEPGATLVYGFAHKVTSELVRRAIDSDMLLPHLQTVPVHAGDVFLIEPGTIHAIGGGVLLAEVQESSNVTYRVYDYGRRDKNGQLRPLHIEKALSVMNFNAAPTMRQQQRIIQYTPGMARELVARCRYFQVERLQVAESCEAQRTKETFYVLLITNGAGTVQTNAGKLPVATGQTVFVPAAEGNLLMTGNMEALLIRV